MRAPGVCTAGEVAWKSHYQINNLNHALLLTNPFYLDCEAEQTRVGKCWEINKSREMLGDKSGSLSQKGSLGCPVSTCTCILLWTNYILPQRKYTHQDQGYWITRENLQFAQLNLNISFGACQFKGLPSLDIFLMLASKVLLNKSVE